MARYARIASTGRFVPPIEVPNSELKPRWPQLPDFVDKMEASSGIRTSVASASRETRGRRRVRPVHGSHSSTRPLARNSTAEPFGASMTM